MATEIIVEGQLLELRKRMVKAYRALPEQYAKQIDEYVNAKVIYMLALKTEHDRNHGN